MLIFLEAPAIPSSHQLWQQGVLHAPAKWEPGHVPALCRTQHRGGHHAARARARGGHHCSSQRCVSCTNPSVVPLTVQSLMPVLSRSSEGPSEEVPVHCRWSWWGQSGAEPGPAAGVWRSGRWTADRQHLSAAPPRRGREGQPTFQTFHAIFWI